MDILNGFLSWAWERHHNVLSWYIRPLFLLPFCYFAYRRSLFGIVLTLVALATSMFWFPAPEQSSSGTLEFLAMEREYLTGEWTVASYFWLCSCRSVLRRLPWRFGSGLSFTAWC